jgi:hypothetical protein
MALPYSTSATLPWGSFTLTTTSGNANGTSYIAEDFEVTESAQLTERPTALGAPNGAFLVDSARTGRGTLQLASTSTVAPDNGDEFVRSLRPNAANVTFFFTEISLPRRVRDFHMVNVTFREKI